MQACVSLMMSPYNGDKIVEVAKSLGIKKFEIVCDNKIPEKIDVVSAQSLFNGINCGGFFKDDVVAEMYANILIDRILDYANKYKCKNFVFGSPKYRAISSHNEAFTAVNFFRKVCDGISNKAILALENNPKEYCTNLGTTFNECLDILSIVDRDNFKINFDIGGFLKSSVDYKYDLKNVLKNADKINHIHISSFGLKPLSELSENEIDDYKKIVNELKKVYMKTISLEEKKNLITNDFIEKEIKLFKEIIC